MGPDDPRFRKMIRQVQLFNGLDPQDVFKIFKRGMTMMFQQGETIINKGTTGNKMYVILGGSAGVYDGKKQLNKLVTGDSFGEMSLLMNEPRTATVIALEHSRLLELDEQVFHKLLTKKVAVQILLNLSKTMGKRLKDANIRLTEQ
jgi:CRP-like cAMP-binding protein